MPEQQTHLSVYTAASVCTSKSRSQIASTGRTHSDQHEVSVQQSWSLLQIPGLAHSTHSSNGPEFLTCQLTRNEFLKNHETGRVSFEILENSVR